MKSPSKILFAMMLSLLTLSSWAQDVFWDEPTILARGNARFPGAGGTDTLQVGVWQESRSTDGWPQFYISLATKTPASPDWILHRRAVGPFSMTGDEAAYYSMVVAPDNAIWLAVLTDKGQVDLFRSVDQGQSFQTTKSITIPSVAGSVYLAPRLFLKADGRPILFLTEGGEDVSGATTFRISSSFWDGNQWTAFVPITAENDRRLNFLPSFTSFAGKEYVVYQSRVTIDEQSNNQLYLKISADGGKSWTEGLWLTNLRLGDQPPAMIDNERPFILSFENQLVLGWERRVRGGQPQIYTASFTPLGVYRDDIDAISEGTFTSISPHLFVFKGTLYVSYFDNARGPFDLYLKSKNKNAWVDETFPNREGDSVFGRPIPTSTELYFFWENTFNGQSNIVLLQPDKRAEPPGFQPQNFQAGERFNQGRYYFSLDLPKDPSGIKGFNYLWDRNPDTQVPPVLKYSALKRILSDEITEEGVWYLHAIVLDGAGNWSKPGVLSFSVDKTPPTPMRIILPPMDSLGNLASNSLDLTWQPTSDDTEGYSARLDYLGPLDRSLDFANLKIPAPAPTFQTAVPKFTLDNQENGWWALSVRTIDKAGNVGEPYSYFFRLNKFNPSTRLTYISGRQDDFGRVFVRIEGRGFMAGGTINRVILDRDGREPWDIVLTRDQFTVQSDRLIDGILLENIPVGVYRVGVVHPERGLTMSGPVIRVDETGTVKFGDFRDLENERWFFPEAFSVFFSVNAAYFWVILLLLFVVVLFSAMKVVVLAREISVTRRHASRIFTDEYLRGTPSAKEFRMKRKGLSLRIKFAISILALTSAVILMLSLTLGFFITENAQRNLGVGLRQKTEVLLDSLVTRASAALISTDTTELRVIPSQISAMDDAVYAVITGKSNEKQPGYNYVWGHNDPKITSKLEGSAFIQGVSVLKDSVTPYLNDLESQINEKAAKALGDLSARADDIRRKQAELRAKGDEAAIRQLTALGDELRPLDDQITSRLREISRQGTASVPPFNPGSITVENRLYTFYKPIVYRLKEDSTVYKGLVRLEVSVDNILKEIDAARNQLVQLTLLVALAALALGLIGALVLATLTINPIKRLVSAVERIRDEEDKEQLKNFEIKVSTRDELAQLAETINEMSHGLAKAAAAAKDLTVGKDTQKMFIPLEKNSLGEKATTGREENKFVKFFGYYEGAKGVSGDYFSYFQLKDDPDYFAMIKCDVSGKGVPAALIMVQVATVFMSFFRDFKVARDKGNIEPVVYRINDIIESLGLRGKFAALMIGLFNVRTGIVTLCNAGDTLVHIFNAETQDFETHKLPDAPATGVFPNDLLELKGGFKQVNLKIKSGDTLFLYTDGIEEAKRHFRDRDFKVIAFLDPNDTSTQVEMSAEGKAMASKPAPGMPQQEAIDNEEMGPENVEAIIRHMYAKKRFSLKKLHNPLPDRPLDFDFTTCEGSTEEVVLALVSVEKIWRLIPDPKAGPNDRIMIDIKIVEFLKKHFVQFGEYFKGKTYENKEKPEYMYYDGLREEDQFDDLTILAVTKK